MEKAMESDGSQFRWLKVAMAVGIVFALAVSLVMYMADREETVIKSDYIGEAVSAQFIDNGWEGMSTSITTNHGTFLVYGVFQLRKGNKLVIETRKNGDRLLCDHSQDICNHLAR